ncbi:MAG: long-chain fatty acid--CoA ligase [Alphaproteobacteria bacterium]|nr:long-chain fatty acid--CoA ligase [Alphaproteobacteria bacterium]
MNIATHMIRAGQAFRDHAAVAQGTRLLLNYGELALRTSCIGTALRAKFNLVAGDRVALVLRNCPEYMELLYACWHAGLIVVPVNAKLHHSDFAYILENSGAKICFTTPELTEIISGLQEDKPFPVIEVASAEYEQLLACPAQNMIHRKAEDIAWLFYTSGTTGKPKGAALTHRNLLAMCHCYFADIDQGAPWRAILHAAPMSHGSGLCGLAHVIQGSCHVIPDSGGFDSAEVFDLIENWPGLCFFAAPTMIKRLLDYPHTRNTENLKLIIYGGGPMYVEDSMAGLERFGPKFAQLYGQGESPMTITALSRTTHEERDHPKWRERLASVGIAQSIVEVRIADKDGEWLSPGDIGEVLVRGDTVMAGYWNNPEATAETLRDGWLHTGDYGVFDEDGFLTLKDRANDVIISGGTNIYPREVEEALLLHPDITEIAVIGRPDREWGETVVAFMVIRDGTTLTLKSLEEFCLKNMARFKRPRDYHFVESLPKNNYGKILKTKLREHDREKTESK